MTVDERLSHSARHVGAGLTPPAVDPDLIRAQARVNRRRTTLLAAVATVATLTAAVAVGTTLAGRASTAPPAAPNPTPEMTSTTSPSAEEPNPFPRAMTPQEVVNHPRAELWSAAVAPDDPDTRISTWSLHCTRPCPERGPHSFDAAALTTDGYETTTYLTPTFPLGVDLQVSTPVDGLFLVTDQSNGGEWLVDLAGDVREVTHVATEIRPTDPRLWFQCPGRWRSTWCSLDPDTATVHEWPQQEWDGSATSPASGDAPWGANPEPRATSSSGRLEAWWDTDDGRKLRTLAKTHEGDYVLGTPPGEMAYWAKPDDTATIELHTSRDRGVSWELDTRAAPGVETEAFLAIRRAPDGAYLATSIYPTLIVWRAEASGGPFRKVYEQPATTAGETSGAGLWVQDDLVYANGFATAAVSDDGGLTWTTVRRWR